MTQTQPQPQTVFFCTGCRSSVHFSPVGLVDARTGSQIPHMDEAHPPQVTVWRCMACGRMYRWHQHEDYPTVIDVYETYQAFEAVKFAYQKPPRRKEGE